MLRTAIFFLMLAQFYRHTHTQKHTIHTPTHIPPPPYTPTQVRNVLTTGGTRQVTPTLSHISERLLRTDSHIQCSITERTMIHFLKFQFCVVVDNDIDDDDDR